MHYAALLTCTRLSRILANILRDLYGIKPPSSDDRYRLAAKYNDELNEWRTSLAYLLDTDGVDPSLFLPIFLRQRNVLNLAFWHAQILVHRPFLLSNFAGLTNYSINRSKLSGNSKLAYHVQRCLDAAMNIVRVVDDLTNQSQIYSTYWVRAHSLHHLSRITPLTPTVYALLRLLRRRCPLCLHHPTTPLLARILSPALPRRCQMPGADLQHRDQGLSRRALRRRPPGTAPRDPAPQ